MRINDVEDWQARKVLNRVKVNMLISKLLVVVAAALAIWRILVGENARAPFLIFLSFAFLIMIWMQHFTTRRLEKLEKTSISAVRDCYDYYVQKAKTQRRRNMLLLVSSKCNLMLREYDKCLQNLEQLQKEKLPLIYLGSYYMQLAIAKRLLGDEEGYQKNYLAYQNVTNEKSPDVARRNRLLGSENPTDALQLITVHESFKKNRIRLTWVLSFAIFLLAAVIYWQGIHLMPTGYEYREWIHILGYYGVLCGALVYSTLIILKLYLWMNRHVDNTAMRVISTIVLIVCIILEILMLLLFSFSEIITHKAETREADGMLRICQQSFLDPEIYYICEKKGVFLRKVLYYEEDGQGESTIDTGKNSSDENNNPEFSSSTEQMDNTEKTSSTEDKRNMKENSSTENNQALADLQMSGDEERIADDYEAIYNYAYKETDNAPQYQYSAKGELYAVLGMYAYTGSADDTTAVQAQKRLIYERDSANGSYDLVVCYEDHYDTAGNKLDDTSILEFYAVNKTTREVIAADKHAWADAGSKEYRDATGE